MKTLEIFVRCIRTISFSSRIRKGRHHADFLADRIVQASTLPTPLGFLEKLHQSMDSDPKDMLQSDYAAALMAAHSPDSASVLAWIRQYPRVCAMLTTLSSEDFGPTLAQIEVNDASSSGIARPDTPHQINISMKCLSPLAHGADGKAGNATVFRRMSVLTDTGNVISLPFYSGNAFRGQMRDLLADDFLRLLGITPRKDRPPISLWFFHALYAGGALEDGGAAEKALKKILGSAGAVKASGIYDFRNALPALSLLGCAMGNRILGGRMKISDFRPKCRQWGTGETDASELMEWLYLTRREDHEAHDEHHGMIANCECLCAGTEMIGGIDPDMHAMPLEISALGRGLRLMTAAGYVGAENRRGLGRVEITADNLPDEAPYVEYVTGMRKNILIYLETIGALDAPDESAGETFQGSGDDIPY